MFSKMCVPPLILAYHSDHKIIIHEWLFKGLSMFPLTFWFGNYMETSKFDCSNACSSSSYEMYYLNYLPCRLMDPLEGPI
jgi:hypothetical protein